MALGVDEGSWGGAEGDSGIGGGGIGLGNVVVWLVVWLGEVALGLQSGVMGAVLWVLGSDGGVLYEWKAFALEL